MCALAVAQVDALERLQQWAGARGSHSDSPGAFELCSSFSLEMPEPSAIVF